MLLRRRLALLTFLPACLFAAPVPGFAADADKPAATGDAAKPDGTRSDAQRILTLPAPPSGSPVVPPVLPPAATTPPTPAPPAPPVEPAKPTAEKPAAPIVDAPKPDAPKTEAPKPDAPKTETPKTAAAKPSLPPETNGAPFWDYKSIALWRRLVASDPISALAFTPDGQTTVGGGDGKVFFWNQTGELTATLETEPQAPPPAPPAPVDPKDDLLGQKKVKPAPPAKANPVTLLSFSPDGRTLATAGSDSTVKLWSVDTKKWLRTLVGHAGPVTAIVWTPDSRALVTGSADKMIKFWNAADGQMLGTLAQHVFPIRALALSADTKKLLSLGANGNGRKNGELKTWDVSGKGDLLQELTLDYVAPTSSILVAEGRILASGGDSNLPTVRFWNGISGEFVRYTTPAYSMGSRVTTIAFSPDYRLVAGGATRTGKKSAIYPWEVRTGKLVKELWGAEQTGVAFSPDGRVLAVAGVDRAVQLWRVP